MVVLPKFMRKAVGDVPDVSRVAVQEQQRAAAEFDGVRRDAKGTVEETNSNTQNNGRNTEKGSVALDVSPLEAIRTFSEKLKEPFVEKDMEAEAITLALMTMEHMVMIGEPGTAKSQIAIRAAKLIGAEVFKYQITRYTEPAELVGPVDIVALKAGEYKRVTKGKLPEAEVAFLDEVFNGSSAILNSLHTLINERVIYDGQNILKVPLLTFIGAANLVPDDMDVAPFYDRIMMRVFSEPVLEVRWKELLEAGMKNEFQRDALDVQPVITKEMIREIYKMLPTVDLSYVVDKQMKLFALLEDRGMHMTDRRKARSSKMIAAHALLNGRTTAIEEDLLVFMYIAPSDKDDFKAVSGMLYEELDTPMGRLTQLRDLGGNLSNGMSFEDFTTFIERASLESVKQVKGGLLQTVESEIIKTSLNHSNDSVRKAAEKINENAQNLLNVIEERYSDLILAKINEGNGALKNLERSIEINSSTPDALRSVTARIAELRDSEEVKEAAESGNKKLEEAAEKLAARANRLIEEAEKLIESQKNIVRLVR